ncbi:LacI family DNA-binding transcriptional regulator [Bifidobacterium mongoliense]|uniref:LacI family DNA-binding transcriptional regulator n=1 Tax=Bifidobacterium mongoliense TaxID=518643 RepID=UPI0030EDA65A
MKPHITIHDIAEMCHVSTATVSRALNGKPGIGTARREQIIKRARALGYVPDATAQSMRSRRTDCVYIVMYSGSGNGEPLLQLPPHEVFESMLGVSVRTHVLSVHDDLVEDLKQIEATYAPLLFVVFGPCLTDSWKFSSLTTPLLFVLSDDAPEGRPAVVSDDFAGALGVTESLLDAGHQRIALVSDSADGKRVNYEHRIEGFREALRRHGMRFDPSMLSTITVDFGDYLESSQEELKKALRSLLREDGLPTGYEPPTAVFVLSDFLALTLLKVVWNAGVRVPKDISLAGFGGWTMTKYAPVTLRTWTQPLADLVTVAGTAVSCLIRSKPFPKTLELSTQHPDGSYGTAIAVTPTTLMVPGFLRTGESVATIAAPPIE